MSKIVKSVVGYIHITSLKPNINNSDTNNTINNATNTTNFNEDTPEHLKPNTTSPILAPSLAIPLIVDEDGWQYLDKSNRINQVHSNSNTNINSNANSGSSDESMRVGKVVGY